MKKRLLLICALLVSVITLSGAANRSFRTEVEQWNPIGFTQAPSGTQITHNSLMGSAILPTVATEAPSGVLRGGSENVITFTTSKKIGETLQLYMKYTGAVPTLTGLTGTPVNGEKVTYKLTSQTVTITGDVTYFACRGNQLTALDVSNNTALTELSCSENQLTALDVSKNTELTYLGCPNNPLRALDVSKNTALTDLICDNNQLTELDLSQNSALRKLACNFNQLKALDLSKNTALTLLSCYRNQLTVLNLPKNTNLEGLYCSSNQLAALDVSTNTKLKEIDCHDNQLSALDVSPLNELVELSCYGNQIEGKEMTRLINSLPDLSDKDAGTIIVIQEPFPEGNVCLKSDVVIAQGKKWFVQKYNTDDAQFVFYEGEEPITYAVTLTKEGEGTLTATGAADLNAVPKGTELTIVATPADRYELTALTANGADILAAKKVVVKGATEVKATFTKIYAVTLTKVGEGMLDVTGADDLTAVLEGTELTVVATPAAGYELKALTANSTDILATKKFVVTVATEVKATFTKKTAADVVESSSVRLYPNPASTYVNVKGAKADALVRLYDANGSLRYEAHTDADGTLQIDLSAYAEGTYLLRVDNDAQRLLIQR